MKAIVITQSGSAEVLKMVSYTDPVASGDEVLIDVRAAGINRADLAQRSGKYPAPAGVPADIPGLEVSGVVIECGELVTQWKPGDKICALLAGGGYAERVVVKEGACLPIPDTFSFAEAAILPEAIFTVWSNIFQRGALQSGEHLLVHGGSSGIGVTAIQLAKAFGAKVFVTVGSEEKTQACIALGAEIAVNYKTQDFEHILSVHGVDVVLDMIGGAYLEKNINIMNPEGRIVYINAMNGNQPNIDIMKVMSKRLTITGSTLRSRSYGFKKMLAAEIREKVWPLLENGAFKPMIFKTFHFEQASSAHELMEASGHIGKIVLVR